MSHAAAEEPRPPTPARPPLASPDASPDVRPELHGKFLVKPSYQFLRTIGEGAEGKCWLHHHEVLDMLVVSKQVSLLGRPGGVALSEPALLKRLDHPQLVEVLEAQWTPGHPTSLKMITFTTRYCEGLSIETAQAEGHQFSTRESLTITADVLDALSYMHEHESLLHRDVKPGNVMLDRDRQRGFLGDLGNAAKMVGDHAPAEAGTPLYRPPEAADGALTPASDVYSLGLTLLEMLNGAFPYDELDHDSIADRTTEGRRALPDRHYAVAPWVPPALARVVRQMVKADADARPASAAAALRSLRSARCVDWRRLDGTGLTGVWEGTWPPTRRTGHGRVHRVSATPVTGGRFAGQVRLEGAWRNVSDDRWRSYARLATRSRADDARALATFFRAVEAEAHNAPAR